MEEVKYTEPLINLNKRVYLMGMNPIQAAVVLIFVLLTMLVHFVIPIVLMIGVVYLFRKAAKENSNGNPDYIKGFLNYIRGPRIIEDNNGGALTNLIGEMNED